MCMNVHLVCYQKLIIINSVRIAYITVMEYLGAGDILYVHTRIIYIHVYKTKAKMIEFILILIIYMQLMIIEKLHVHTNIMHHWSFFASENTDR